MFVPQPLTMLHDPQQLSTRNEAVSRLRVQPSRRATVTKPPAAAGDRDAERLLRHHVRLQQAAPALDPALALRLRLHAEASNSATSARTVLTAGASMEAAHFPARSGANLNAEECPPRRRC